MDDKDYEETIKQLINIRIPLSGLLHYEDRLIQSIQEAIINTEKNKKLEGLVEAVSILHKSFPLLYVIRKPKDELTDKDKLMIYLKTDPNMSNYIKTLEDYFQNIGKTSG